MCFFNPCILSSDNKTKVFKFQGESQYIKLTITQIKKGKGRVNYIKCRSFVHQGAVKKEEREAPQRGKGGTSAKLSANKV